MLRAHGLVVMTTPLQGVDPQFDPGWAHLGEAINWLRQFNSTAMVVEWYNTTLPTLWPEFDSRPSHFFPFHNIYKQITFSNS
jgi:hypothetical protein